MNVVVYKRGAHGERAPAGLHAAGFRAGAGATDKSLIGAGRSLVVENNYGYSGPTAAIQGATTTPGLERVDIKTTGGCKTVWRNRRSRPPWCRSCRWRTGSSTPTRSRRIEGNDAWYFTALDFRTGTTVYKRLAGTGLGFNNNFAPVSLGPDGSAYVGTLGGLVLLRDR